MGTRGSSQSQLRTLDQEGIKSQTLLSRPGLEAGPCLAQVDTGLGPENGELHVAVTVAWLLPAWFLNISLHAWPV